MVIVDAGAAQAQPVDPIVAQRSLIRAVAAPDGSRIVSANLTVDNHIWIDVLSTAMNRVVKVYVQRPADASRPQPTLYLLNGAGGGEDAATWTAQTDVQKFLSDKNANVVQPMVGAWTYYTDWRAPDPHLGVNKWRTFLTEELPPIIDAALGTNGVNAIAGLSTSGTSVLQLAISRHGLYRAAAAYSGCAQISDPIGYRFVNVTVNTWGGGDTMNMYGPEGDPMWRANDPYLNAEGLRGVDLFISTGTGMPGIHDRIDDPHLVTPGVAGLLNQEVVGGAIESGTNWCTRNLQNRLDQLGIAATYDFQPTGTHSWGYWEDAFKKSWPVLSRGLGI
ncbi:esterase family protein [Aldersonia sp. NBC_00410]|uniref:alpha/beta hydrolase n=1 Tax=Aldersonia sp. NBC_00410 TaxID=2975954 RepID=UPI002250F3BB|nr:alpha/beta hydrolase family protein [Aldersonia sp. NBC_00410]MCX5042656.1 esterase family protein [Aldersonia sp. NBC_00410]